MLQLNLLIMKLQILFILLMLTKSISAHKYARYVTFFAPLPIANLDRVPRLCIIEPNCQIARVLIDSNYYAMLRNRNRRIPKDFNQPLQNNQVREGAINQDVENDDFSRWGRKWPEFDKNYMIKRRNRINKPTVAKVSKMLAAYPRKYVIMDTFYHGLQRFERKFYMTTFEKLTTVSPEERQENSISFVQSGLFVYLALIALSLEEDPQTKAEIDKCLQLPFNNQEKLRLIKEVLSLLPNSTKDFKFTWTYHLAVNGTWQFQNQGAKALGLGLEVINGTDSPENISASLNRIVEQDSGGSMRYTFTDDELSGGISSVFISTAYLRPHWRSSPTLLNGTFKFRDGKSVRDNHMIRVNDVMRYADLGEWDAEAIEIFYSVPHLSFLIILPRRPSLRKLAERILNEDLHYVTSKMQPRRLAVRLPIYTLRMTLLLPNKLEAMGIQRLFESPPTDNKTAHEALRVSHAVQRLMFWAEAGRNAFKDDGLEWDVTPECEITVDRPYIFFLRWKNLTIANGNFVL